MLEMTREHVPKLSSTEGELDRQAEHLLGRIINGQASPKEQVRFREISSQRTNRMIGSSDSGALRPSPAKSKRSK